MEFSLIKLLTSHVSQQAWQGHAAAAAICLVTLSPKQKDWPLLVHISASVKCNKAQTGWTKLASLCCSLFTLGSSFVFIHAGLGNNQPSGSRHQITGTPFALLSTFYLSNRKSLISLSQCAGCISILCGINVSASFKLHFKEWRYFNSCFPISYEFANISNQVCHLKEMTDFMKNFIFKY